MIRRPAVRALAGEIESVWALSSPSPGEDVILVPAGCAQLIWPIPGGRLWLQDAEQARSGEALCGPLLCMADTCGYRITLIDPLPPLVLGADFAPGRAEVFLRAALGEAGPDRQPLVDLWGRAAVRHATQRLVDAMQHSAMGALAALELEMQARWPAPDESASSLHDVLEALMFTVDMGGALAGLGHRWGTNDRHPSGKARNPTGPLPKP